MNSFFIRVLKFLVNAAWYLQLLFVPILAMVIGYMVWTNNYLDWSVPVRLNQVSNLPPLQSTTELYKYAGIEKAEALLKIKVKPPAAFVITMAIGFVCYMGLLFCFLYQLRKILNSLQAGVPFAYENIRRLRLISLYIFLMALVGFLNGLGNILVFRQQFPQAKDIYWPRAELGFTPVIASLIVLVLAEVFRQGYQLKTENESFV